MSIDVSICIPCYKNIPFLKRCLQSVITQTYTNYELVISDDSPDTSVELFVKEFLKDVPHIYLHNSPALGSPENWNNAIKASSGKYIKVLHHDDRFCDTNALQIFVNTAKLYPDTDFFFCDTLISFGDDAITEVHRITNTQHKRLLHQPEFLLFKNCIGAPSATFYKRDEALSYNPDFIWLVDLEFYIHYLRKHKRFHHIPQTLVNTFSGAEGQITNAVSSNKHIVIKEYLQLMHTVYSEVPNTKKTREFFSELFEAFNIDSFDTLNTTFTIPKKQVDFYKVVFEEAQKHKMYKKLKKRLLTSRYNKRWFQIERF
jgi:glycosyltransferase involved in cell wall biosynthesis